MFDYSALSPAFFLSIPLRCSSSIIGKEPWLSMNFLRDSFKNALRHS